MGPARLTRKEVYDQLIRAKNAIHSLSFEQLLAKDLKILDGKSGIKVGIASISGSLVNDLLKDQQHSSLKQFCSRNDFNAFLILGISNNNPKDVRRDLVIYSPNKELLSEVILS